MRPPRKGWHRPTRPPKPFKGPVGDSISMQTVGQYLREWGAGPTRVVKKKVYGRGRW